MSHFFEIRFTPQFAKGPQQASRELFWPFETVRRGPSTVPHRNTWPILFDLVGEPPASVAVPPRRHVAGQVEVETIEVVDGRDILVQLSNGDVRRFEFFMNEAAGFIASSLRSSAVPAYLLGERGVAMISCSGSRSSSIAAETAESNYS